MAILKTDRERRMQGDRLVAQETSFGGIHSAVGEVHQTFRERHGAFKNVLEERQREETEDETARNERDRLQKHLTKLYSWGYGQVVSLMHPNWKSVESEESTETVQERLFPLGSATDVRTAQLILDGTTHFLAAQERETKLAYPTEFIDETRSAHEQLKNAMNQVTVEGAQTRDAVDQVEVARNQWDDAYASLRDVSRGFLRLRGDLARMDVLFRALPDTTSKSEDGEVTETSEDSNVPDVPAE